jgi:Cu(I)/Ag(I) efflux system membrane fusion protein
MTSAKTYLLLGVAGAVLAGAAGYQLGLQRAPHPTAPRTSGTAAAPAADGKQPEVQGERRVLYWHDPMVPGQRFDKPGKSPFMDMQLVPVYADEATEGGASISPRLQQSLGVRTAQVAKGTLSSPLRVVGNVAFNERDLAVVTARNAGYVEKLFVRTTLQPVRRGEPLAQLYVPEWVAAQEEYLSARRLDDPRFEGLADAARQRMALTGMPEAVMKLVETSQAVQPRVTVSAPISGIVSELSVREGATLAMGMPLFRINGIATVWVNAEVPEAAAARVAIGMTATASSAAYPERRFSARVSAILPDVNPTTRTLRARLEVRNPEGRLVPGMLVAVDFPPPEARETLIVPTDAVVRTGTRNVVFVADGTGTFSPTQVETGSEANGQIEIRRGLQAGQRVVVSGQFLIDSEASLRGTQTRMLGETAAADAAQNPPAREAAPVFHAQGVVESVDEHEVTLSHGPVAALSWPAMTMGFKLPPAGLALHLHPGMNVHFGFRKVAGGYELVSAEPVPPAKGAQQ